ncbi:hypothetical protein LZD38_08865 [Streptococcus gallolyticus]|uniref:hypothetical protein n=1 Tax=Streptococcus gallolyticus TaxID=315405 RepID=UPI001F3D7D9C|nr:hypothetical protein [Streptococcus gallolyticus]MCF1634794.1 hypothetical protein [Streptococcus gallolyticus]
MKTKKVVLMSIMLALLIISSKLIIPLPLLDFISIQIIIVYMLYPILGKYHSFCTAPQKLDRKSNDWGVF